MLPEMLVSRLYGIFMALGIYLAAWLAARIVTHEKLGKDTIWDGFIWVVVPGIIGARLYHVVDYWQYYQTQPGLIMAVWRGGLGIYGALVGGLLGMLIYGKFKNFSWRNQFILWEAVIIGVPLAQFVGRWGNYFNQELYGQPTQLPWAITIDPAHRLGGYETYETFHPLFLYESLLNLCLFGLMYYLYSSRKVRPGKLAFIYIYMIGYGLIRAMLEPMRLETWSVSGISIAQAISAILVVIGSLGLLWWSKHKKSGWKNILLGCGILIFVGCNQSPSLNAPDTRVTPETNRKYTTLNLANQTLNLEVVDTPQTITLGLSYRQELGADGMLFVMPSRGVQGFWMKGMQFNLDIVWFDCGVEGVGQLDVSTCETVYVTRNAPAPTDPEDTTNLPVYSPSQPVTHVLELVAGDYEKWFE